MVGEIMKLPHTRLPTKALSTLATRIWWQSPNSATVAKFDDSRHFTGQSPNSVTVAENGDCPVWTGLKQAPPPPNQAVTHGNPQNLQSVLGTKLYAYVNNISN